jgi:tetratricopeptide (TPR) repeat protein
VSTIQYVAILCFSTSLYAQLPLSSAIGISGEYPGHSSPDYTNGGANSVPLRSASGENPIGEESQEFEPGNSPLDLNWPGPSAGVATSNVVSLHDLQHPIPQKAIQEAYEAQKLARSNNFAKAIAKLEHAIRLAPTYRDAHVNLGVQYARVGRGNDARAEFRKAIDIGPPIAPAYADMALVSLSLNLSQEADTFAHKALELDPENRTAQKVLQYMPTH